MLQLRRERIAERIRALQELVPTVNKVGVSFYLESLKGLTFHLCLQTDRAAMIDEIVDYVKFLRLQVKVTYLVVCIILTNLELVVCVGSKNHVFEVI